MFSRLFIAILLTTTLAGCATMNQSECLNADWQLIGLEDGSRGRDLAFLGNHRKACAEFGISPDLSAYQAGHQQGVRRFCTYNRGFQLGLRGSGYNDICPPDLADAFRFGHQRGREIHAMNREIQRVKNEINKAAQYLQDLHDDIAEMEELIIARGTRPVDRALLLIELKEAQTEIGRLEVELDLMHQQKADMVYERNMRRQEYALEPR